MSHFRGTKPSFPSPPDREIACPSLPHPVPCENLSCGSLSRLPLGSLGWARVASQAVLDDSALGHPWFRNWEASVPSYLVFVHGRSQRRFLAEDSHDTAPASGGRQADSCPDMLSP